MDENKTYTISEEFDLPSKGVIYEKEINPHVKLRAATGREEMRRTGKTKTQYKVLSDMIEACMIEKPSISVYDMYIGDFEYLLHKWRIVTYGEKYNVTSVCPYCGNVEDVTFDLDKEETLDFDVTTFKDLLTVTLPTSGKIVTLKFQTPRMLDSIKLKTDELVSQSKDANIDYERWVTLKESIDLVDNQKLSYAQLEEFINKLSARDTNKLERRFEKINKLIGLKNEARYTCNKCKEEVLTFFRYGPEFFRPSDDE